MGTKLRKKKKKKKLRENFIFNGNLLYIDQFYRSFHLTFCLSIRTYGINRQCPIRSPIGSCFATTGSQNTSCFNLIIDNFPMTAFSGTYMFDERGHFLYFSLNCAYRNIQC